MFKLNKKTKRIIFTAIVFLIMSLLGINTFNETDINPQRDVKLSEESIYKVVEVVDGDTFKFTDNGEVFTARIVGIDTPEKNHPQKPVECFAQEASKKTEELILGKNVYLEYDTEQDTTDRYGRLLVHVWIGDKNGDYVNSYLIKNGYAHAYTSAPSKNLQLFIELEEMAREDKIGLWGDVCLNYTPPAK